MLQGGEGLAVESLERRFEQLPWLLHPGEEGGGEGFGVGLPSVIVGDGLGARV